MARTYSNLYPQIYDFSNLHAAYLKARKGKRYSVDVLRFSAHLENNLIDIQNRLIWKEFCPSPYHFFIVHEPKRRMIAAAPFSDRVVHHALCNITEPIFERSFIYDSYACRNSRGVLAGVNRTTQFMRRARRKWGRFFCLKGDVSKFFPSVNHCVLKSIIRKRIACSDTLVLMDRIIDSSGSGTGLPIGNLTSQLWANVYLNELDHFCKDILKICFYIRYMDDFVIFHHDKSNLRNILLEIEGFLGNSLRLSLNGKTQIFPVGPRCVDFLGYRIWPDYRLLRKSNIKRTKNKIKRFAKMITTGTATSADVRPSIMSWIGHCKHADTWRLRTKILRKLKIQRRK